MEYAWLVAFVSLQIEDWINAEIVSNQQIYGIFGTFW